MKNIIKIGILAAIIIACGTQSSFAAGTTPEPVSLKQILINHINYPDFTIENGHGFVLMAITVNEDGTLVLSEINASSQELLKYTLKEVEKIRIEHPEDYIGNTHYYRIDFIFSSNR